MVGGEFFGALRVPAKASPPFLTPRSVFKATLFLGGLGARGGTGLMSVSQLVHVEGFTSSQLPDVDSAPKPPAFTAVVSL